MKNLNKEIIRLRHLLNKLVEKNEDFGKIYAVSTALDKLIVQYYNVS